MIKYINKHVGFNRDILESITVLNEIWEAYTELVYKYNQKPTIEEYALLIGIHRDTIYSWAKGECRADDYCEKLNLSRSDTIKNGKMNAHSDDIKAQLPGTLVAYSFVKLLTAWQRRHQYRQTSGRINHGRAWNRSKKSLVVC